MTTPNNSTCSAYPVKVTSKCLCKISPDAKLSVFFSLFYTFSLIGKFSVMFGISIKMMVTTYMSLVNGDDYIILYKVRITYIPCLNM